MSNPPIPTFGDAIDTFYQWVLAAVQAVMPSQGFGGIVEARDWPPKTMAPAVPYLATLRDIPTKSPHQSFYAPMISDILEWRWALIGDNIPPNAQAANRGDKYRQNVALMGLLLSAHNPGYAPMQQWSVAPDANNNPVKVGTPYDPPEYLWWTIPEFTRKVDRQTGMVYTAGQVQVTAYAPVAANS